MGLAYANIQLQNGDDVSCFRRGLIAENDIYQVEIRVLVNKNSVLPTINESIRQALNLPIIATRNIKFSNEKYQKLPIVGSMIVKYLDRWSLTNAILLPDDQEPLLCE